jgi:hypothetical protein
MLGQLIWWATAALEVVLLVRGVRGDWAPRYRIFYGYILFVLAQSSLRFVVYHSNPLLYPYIYWLTEFLAVLIGCGVTFEIYRVGLSAFPGTARMARNVLGIVFVLATTKALVDAPNYPRWWPMVTSTKLELALRVVQAASIGMLVLLFLVYKVPFGKNLRGIVLGYGLFVSLSVIQFAFISVQGERLIAFWSSVQSLAYLLVLGIWVTHLWSYRKELEPGASVRLEVQYQRAAAATRQRLREARGYLGKAVGS